MSGVAPFPSTSAPTASEDRNGIDIDFSKIGSTDIDIFKEWRRRKPGEIVHGHCFLRYKGYPYICLNKLEGNIAQVKAHLAKIIKEQQTIINAASVDAWIRLGYMYHMQGNLMFDKKEYHRAASQYSRCNRCYRLVHESLCQPSFFAQNPSVPEATLKRIKDKIAMLLFDMGDCFFVREKLPQALASYEESLQFNSKYPAVYLMIAFFYWRSCEEKSAGATAAPAPPTEVKSPNVSKASSALNLLQEDESTNSPDPEMFSALPEGLEGQEYLQKALANCDKGLEVYPCYYYMVCLKGCILNAFNERDAALKEFDKAIKLKDDNKRVYMYRAHTFLHQGKTEEVLKTLEQVVQCKDHYHELEHWDRVHTLPLDPEKNIKNYEHYCCPCCCPCHNFELVQQTRQSNDASVATLKGYAYWYQQRFAKSCKELEVAIQSAQYYDDLWELSELKVTLALAYSLDNRHIEALQAFDECLANQFCSFSRIKVHYTTSLNAVKQQAAANYSNQLQYIQRIDQEKRMESQSTAFPAMYNSSYYTYPYPPLLTVPSPGASSLANNVSSTNSAAKPQVTFIPEDPRTYEFEELSEDEDDEFEYEEMEEEFEIEDNLEDTFA